MDVLDEHGNHIAPFVEVKLKAKSESNTEVKVQLELGVEGSMSKPTERSVEDDQPEPSAS